MPVDIWFTTDRKSSHEQFARGVSRILDEIDWASTDACFAVDWTAMNALHVMSADSTAIMQRESVPVMYLTYRSYASMTGISDDDRDFYSEVERNAVRRAVSSGGGVVALCDDDWRTQSSFTDNEHAVRVILPMLRTEFSTVADEDKGKILDFGRKRQYLVSLVRLSEDKGPHRFVQMLRDIQQEDPTFWDRTGVVPLLCGAASQPEYAARVKRELLDAVPNAVLVDRFLPPLEMAHLMQQAILNVHGALYEAYGLTIVEAAAMGCPSVINTSGIGAAQLLSVEDGAVEAVNILDRGMLVKRVKRIVEDDAYRIQLMHQAYMKATSWREEQHVAMLEDFTRERIDVCKKSAAKAPQ